jgi:serine/threonine protein kinase/tetratricopeptide (TPR) repeat protein
MTMIGQTIGHYQVVEEIGRGGMGVVYKALDTKLSRPVAIKSLKADDAQDETAKKRFLREAMTVAQLDHPYICKVYEILEHAGQTYIVLEFVRGRSLSDVIADPAQVLPLEKALDFGREVAEALEEAHKHGIIHRDIKPNNIMLLESGHIKVLDFGLAKALPTLSDSSETTSANLTKAGQVVGTLGYMSPEQITGRPADARSDIFALGVVLFEMVAGRRPFSGDTAAQVAASIMTADPEPLHRYRTGVPDGLDRVVGRMLAKDPGERYQSVHEVRVELRHLQDDLVTQSPRAGRTASQARAAGDQPTSALSTGELTASAAVGSVPSAQTRRGWLASRARRWAVGSVTAAGVVAVVAFVFWYQGSQPALSFAARDWILVSDFENLTGDSIFDKSLATALNVSLSQSTHANVFSKVRTNTVLQRMGKKPDTPVDEQAGREVCQRENIRGLICPSIGKVGNTFVITARIVDPHTGDGVRSYVERADDYDHILSALDAVAASVRKGLGESLAQVQASSRPLAKVTTSSLTALKSYSEAQQLWGKNQYKAALDLDEAAVKEDPDFAMAHAALGVYYASFVFNETVKAKEHYKKSLGLADRTTEREKMVIRLQYENQYGTPDSARNLFEAYLRAYPDSIVQRYNYAGMLRDHQELDKAVQQYKEVIRIAPDHASAFINLATTYSLQGKDREALATYELAFKLEPTWVTSGNLNHEYGFTFVSIGEYDKARSIFTQGLATPIKTSALRSLALLDLYLGKYRDAKPKLNEAILLNVTGKSLLSEARNHLFMSILLDGEGNPAGVQSELDKAAKCMETVPPQPWLSARIAIGWARGRSVEKAARALEKVKKDTNPNDPAQNRELHRLEGEIELARGNQPRGLELLALADKEDHGPLSIESLARAQRLAGKADEAIGSYEVFMVLRGRAEGWEPQQYWFAAHTELAKLYIARKEPEKARRVLQELLDLWKGADPELPLYKEAQRLNQAIAGGPR